MLHAGDPRLAPAPLSAGDPDVQAVPGSPARAASRIESAASFGARFGPLAVASLLGTAAGPLLNAILGAHADPARELAGFWTAFAAVLALESGCLALQSASTVMARAGMRPARLDRAALVVGGATSALVAMLAATAPGHAAWARLSPGSADVAAVAERALAGLALLPLLVALRAVSGGQLLAAGRTRAVANGAVTRVALLLIATLSTRSSGASGAATAALAVVLAAAAEVLVLRASLGRPAPTDAPIPDRDLVRLAAPLAMATLVWTATRPALHAVLGHLADPDRAQAAFTLLIPVVMLAGAPVWTLQDLAVARPEAPGGRRRFVRHAAGVAAVVAVLLAGFAVTPGAAGWLAPGVTLPAALLADVRAALPWVALVPVLLTVRAVAQGELVRAGRTHVLPVLAPLRIGLVVLCGCAIAQAFPHANGARLGLFLWMAGDAFEALACGLALGDVREPRRDAGVVLCQDDPEAARTRQALAA